MRQTFYCLTALPKDSEVDVWVGHTYAQKRNALRFAESVRDTFRRVSVWQGQPGSVLVTTLGEPYPAPRTTYVPELDSPDYAEGRDAFHGWDDTPTREG